MENDDDDNKDSQNELTVDQTRLLDTVLSKYWKKGLRHKLMTVVLGNAVKFRYDREQIRIFLQDFNVGHPIGGEKNYTEKEINGLIDRYFDKQYEKFAPGVDKDFSRKIFWIFKPAAIRKKIFAEGFEFWLDSINGVGYDGKNLYKLTEGKKGVSKKFLVWIPMDLKSVVKDGDEWKIRYLFNDVERIDTIPAMKSNISVSMSTTREDNKYLSEFLLQYVRFQISKKDYETHIKPIYVNDDLIHVYYETPLDTPMNLKLLREFYNYVMNQPAFLSVMSYCLTAPLHRYIRAFSPVGYILPHHISHGMTGASKTTTDAIFVLTGWGQTKDEGLLTANQVATKFTLMKHLSEGNLPILINDVSPEWLDKVSTELKSASETDAFGDRGQPNQTIRQDRMLRSILVTLNQHISPSDDAARNRRYILEEYTKEHGERKNVTKYNEFIKGVQPGFLFSIFREIFDGRSIFEVVNGITEKQTPVDFVNYGIDRINELCRKYGIELFPKYQEMLSEETEGSFRLVGQYIFEQWKRIDDLHRDLKTPYPELSNGEIDVDNLDESLILYFTAGAFRKMAKRLDLPYKKVTDFLNNYVKSDEVGIHAVNKSHKFAGTPLKAYAIYLKVK